MDNNNTAEDHFVDAEVIDPVVSESDPQLSSAGPPEYVTPPDLKGQKEKEAHLVGKEWKDRKKDSKKLDKEQQQRNENDDDDNGDSGGINGMQSTVIISVAVVAVVGVLLAVTRKFCVR